MPSSSWRISRPFPVATLLTHGSASTLRSCISRSSIALVRSFYRSLPSLASRYVHVCSAIRSSSLSLSLSLSLSNSRNYITDHVLSRTLSFVISIESTQRESLLIGGEHYLDWFSSVLELAASSRACRPSSAISSSRARRPCSVGARTSLASHT